MRDLFHFSLDAVLSCVLVLLCLFCRKRAGGARKVDTRQSGMLGTGGTQARTSKQAKSILEESVSIQRLFCIDTVGIIREQNVWVSIQDFSCIDTEGLKSAV